MKRWLQPLRATFESLAPRERLLISVVALLVALAVVWFGVVQRMLDYRARAEERVAAAERELQVIQRLREEFEEVKGRLSSVEQRIASGESANLRTTLETLASRAAVKIESMEPQASPASDRYRETKVEVGLKQVTLPQTVRYLHEIEQTSQVLSVKTLRIRTRSDNPELLDVTFTVSSFERI
jgi:general secretion pathway protein M